MSSSKSILSFFKISGDTANNSHDGVVNSQESCCTVVNNVNSDVNSNAACASPGLSLPEKPFHPLKVFVFPKTKFRTRYCSCHHKWFESYPWLHYGIDNDCIFCFYCMKNLSKLTAEKNKEPAYTLIGFKNWKIDPECFKDHQNSKCHKGTATLEIIVPSSGEPLAMMN